MEISLNSKARQSSSSPSLKYPTPSGLRKLSNLTVQGGLRSTTDLEKPSAKKYPFQKLPFELQREIFGHVVPDPRTYRLHVLDPHQIDTTIQHYLRPFGLRNSFSSKYVLEALTRKFVSQSTIDFYPKTKRNFEDDASHLRYNIPESLDCVRSMRLTSTIPEELTPGWMSDVTGHDFKQF